MLRLKEIALILSLSLSIALAATTTTTVAPAVEPVEVTTIPAVTVATTTTTTPPPPPEPIEPGKQSSIKDIDEFFQKTKTTCCHVQTACSGCRNFYDTNGVRYCCPSCRGVAMVTNLVCTCYPAVPFDPQSVHCKVNSSEVVGGYQYIKPSYFPNTAHPSTNPSLPLTLVLCVVLSSFIDYDFIFM